MKLLKMIGESSTTINVPILAVKELRSCIPVECIIGILRYSDIHTSWNPAWQEPFRTNAA